MKNKLQKSILFLFTAVAVCGTEVSHAQTISTVAGNGVVGFAGDGMAATTAELNYPYAVALDTTGNLYIADEQNQRIRMVSKATGQISTLIGNGVAGFAGDGTDIALVNKPQGLAVDKLGNIYFADKNNHRIRSISTLGIVQTVVGSGVGGYSGDNGPALLAKLNYPTDVILDTAGNLYIADSYNNAVRKVNMTTGIITAYAGNGYNAGTGLGGYSGDIGPATSAHLWNPTGLAFDTKGNLYIADNQNNVIRKVSKTDSITTIAGNGVQGFAGDGQLAEGQGAELSHPNKVTVDTAGNIYIADAANHRIRRIDAVTKKISTVAGNGIGAYNGDGILATNAEIFTPTGITIDKAGHIYIADNGNYRVRSLTIPATSVVAINGSNSTVKVYPNPTNNNVTIKGLDLNDKICVYDMIGRVVSPVVTVSQSEQTISVKELPIGTYIINIWDNAGSKKESISILKQ
ncbi:MAG: T9SS type A sorting domain-containing protein [Bacteroidota bacterium]